MVFIKICFVFLCWLNNLESATSVGEVTAKGVEWLHAEQEVEQLIEQLQIIEGEEVWKGFYHEIDQIAFLSPYAVLRSCCTQGREQVAMKIFLPHQLSSKKGQVVSIQGRLVIAPVYQDQQMVQLYSLEEATLVDEATQQRISFTYLSAICAGLLLIGFYFKTLIRTYFTPER